MKPKTLITITTAVVLALAPGPAFAQQALKTDTAGNPVTPLNLGGGNVTGTLAAARLPAGIGAPVVQTIPQTQGSVALAAGVNVAVLTAPLTGALTLRLPAAGSYPAGRVLVVVDPGGYSGADHAVSVAPGGGDLLNGNGNGGGVGALPVLAGTGAASLYPDGATRWSTGQSYLRAPSTAGLTLAGPAFDASGTALSALDGNGQEIFAVRGDGTAAAAYLDAVVALSSDTALIYSDGNGGWNAQTLTANSAVATFYDVAPLDSQPVSNSDTAARLYYGDDGALHVRTPDRVDHTLTWTTTP